MKALLRRIRQILKDRRTRRFLTRFVSGIAAVVVFVTTYALVLPAITMESEAACGIEAHQHDDSCYTENLICGQEESEGHHHTEDCYTVTKELECQIQEHQHSLENGCFDEEGNLVCEQEEHTHSDSCYKEHRELTCGLEESEGHHHTDSCYEKVLTCGKEVHTHSAACYKTDLKIESAAVASTGVTSAAAVPDLSDEDIYSEEPEHSQDDPAANEALDEQDQTDEDEEHTDDGLTSAYNSEDETRDDAAADIQNDEKDKGNSEEGEEAASYFSTGFASDDMENGDAYIPEKDALDFNTVLNSRTGIYYHHVAEDEEIEDSSAITDWNKADEDTELNPQDLIRMYLSYTLPKDTINATNDISRYRLPDALHLTDEQVEAINNCENGISALYIDYDNLEVTDSERHTAYLGLESVEGRRRPGEELKEDSQEYISAVVRAEKIYDGETGEYEGTDLIFTFSPYTVEKNAHAYDRNGQPTRAGEEVTGWLTLDFNMGQIDWSEDNTSEIIFAEEDRDNKVSEISTVLKQADSSQAEDDGQAADGMTEAAAEDMTADEDAANAATEIAAADETAETAAQDVTEEAAAADVTAETAAADNTVEKAEEAGTEKTAAAAEAPADEKDKKEESVAAGCPAAVFDDSITVRSGRLDSDLDDTDIPKKTKMTVHVEADEGTFPEGTKMVLSAVEDLDAVAEAVGTAIDAKTRGFQAVDITFYDKDPSEEDAKEIQPLKPIRVSIKSDEIRKAAEDSSTAPVVVHIEDNNTATEVESTASKTDSAAIEIEKPGKDDAGTDEAVNFEADSFSVYAIVYAVDFHAKVISANGETYEITVTCGEDAQIPYGSELKVREILPEDEEYDSLYKDAVEKANIDAKKQGIEIPVVSDARLFDIEIQGPEGKIEPAAPVQVSIRLIGATSEVLSVVHFAEQGPESMELVEKSAGKSAGDEVKGNADSSEGTSEGTPDGEENAAEPVSEVSFVATSFSVYSVIGFGSSVDLVNDGPFVLTSLQGPSMYTADDPDDKDVLKYALTSDIVTFGQNNTQTLGGKVVYQHTGTSQSENYMGGSVTEWYFEKYNTDPNDHRYYIYTLGSNGAKQYIYPAQNQNILLTSNRNNDCLFTVEESGGKIRLHINYDNYSWSIRNNRTGGSDYASSSYFTTTNGSGNSTLFTLGKRDPDYDEKAAKKVSAADYNAGSGNPGNWNAGSTVVIYRRVVHDDGSELLYALATDGTWVPAYDGGDSIYYHCPEGKDVRWKVRHEEDGYHVTSVDGTVSIAPSKTDNTWSVANSDGVGLTMNGLGSGYGSQIEVWDQAEYAYAGLHLPVNSSGQLPSSTTKVQPGIEDESDTFLFAVIPDESLVTQGTKHEVQTVDSDALGITIKMYDYTDSNATYNYDYRQAFMQSVLGDDMRTDWDTRKFFVTKMVKDTLNDDGYPVSLTDGKGSLENLFKAGTYNYDQFYSWNGFYNETIPGGTGTVTEKRATNLFLKSYYDENGMFRYSSLENYAYLTSDKQNTNGAYKFDVYREAGTPNIPKNNDQYYFYHGHFMPYNELDETQDISRIVDQYGYLEDPDSGRVYDDLYGVKGTPDYYFGMTMEANFVQPEGGTLANGDPVIYRFTGDDDLWVFIDGVKVLDVSGIHEALTGSINFETGIVEQPDYYGEGGTAHGHHEVTLYKLFSDAGIAGQFEWVDVNNDNVPDTFADYTTHSFKMFYLERGAGASNLDLQFNLQVVKAHEFTVEKKLPDDVDTRFVNQTYRYRATYIDEHTHQERPLYAYKDGQGNTHTCKDSQGHEICTKVIYKDRKDEHGQPIEVPVPIDDQGYFELKPGEGAVFTMNDQTTEYNVREVGINRDLVSQVDINTDKNVTINHNSTYGDYAEAGADKVEKRSHVIYRNYPYVQNLRITKHITEDSLPREDGKDPVFEFRVYLESSYDADGNPFVDDNGNPITKLRPYSYGPYYLVKIPEGQEENESAWEYYKLNGENNTPVRLDSKDICSETGRSGSINSIPPEYTIIIPNLAIGTHFYVEERRDNLPGGGYEFDHEELKEGTYEVPDTSFYDKDAYEHDHSVIERTLARDETDHQEFDPSTIGRIKQRQNNRGVDAESHIYNRRPAIQVPVEKVWDPELDPGATPAPSPVEVALVRFKGPEPSGEDTPAPAKGAIRVNHNILLVDGEDEEHQNLPEGFVAEYTVTDSEGRIVVAPTTRKGPYDLAPGNYTVSAVVKRPHAPEGYRYDSTPSVTDVTVTADQTTEVTLTSRYITPNTQVDQGTIVITHESAGLPNSSLPVGFQVTYTIRNSGGQVVMERIPAGTYNVSPGTYTVTADVTNPAAPSGYSYESTSGEQRLTVASGAEKTAAFTSTYAAQSTEQGFITLNHTSSGLQNSSLPSGFDAHYVIEDENEGGWYFDEPVERFAVPPGTYTVIVIVNDSARPDGYTYKGTSPERKTVVVTDGNEETVDITSTYVQQGTLVIGHTFSGLENNSMPNGFRVVYTAVDAGQNITRTFTAPGEYPVEPGNYTVTANVTNYAAPTGFTGQSTTPAQETVQISGGGSGTANFTSTYAQQAARNTITINHVSSGLPDSPALPNGFNATYTITRQSDNAVVYENVPAGTYVVTPDYNYLVTTNVSYPATPAGYNYENTNNSNPDAPWDGITLWIGNGDAKTADFISTYSKWASELTIPIRVGKYDFNGIAESWEVHISPGDTITLTIKVNPNEYSNPEARWYVTGNSYYNGSKPIDREDLGNGTYTFTINPTKAIYIDALGNTGNVTASLSINGSPVAAAPLGSDTFTANAEKAPKAVDSGMAPAAESVPDDSDYDNLIASVNVDPRVSAPAYFRPVSDTFVVYADGDPGEGQSRADSQNGETNIAPLSETVQQRVLDTVTMSHLPDGYTLDTDFGRKYTLNSENDWQHIFDKLPELDEHGNPYYYGVVELAELDDYTVSYTDSPISAEYIRESMKAQQEQPAPPLLTLTATNTKKTGNLKLVKAIAAGSDSHTTDEFTFRVTITGTDPSRLLLDGSPIADSSISTSGNNTVITVKMKGAVTHTITGILTGATYEVEELTTPAGIMPDDWQQKGTVEITSDVEGGADKTITAEETETAKITNEETRTVEAIKTWAPTNPGNVQIYFKLFYQRIVTPEGDDPYIEEIEVAGKPIIPLPLSEDTSVMVHWDDLPVYMDDGSEYIYLVKEYVAGTENDHDYEENGSYYTEAAPEGYVKVENGLSITNTKSEEYNPTTNYTGTKRWVDFNNKTRPDSLRVTLMINDHNPDVPDQPATYMHNGEPVQYTAQWTQGKDEYADEWYYTFKDLPIFDASGNAIDYYVVETTPGGYQQETPQVTNKVYQRLSPKENNHVVTDGSRDRTITIPLETDLPFVAIMTKADDTQYGAAYRHHVWTPRQLVDDEERQAVLDTVNMDQNIPRDLIATLDNTRFVTGQPTGDPQNTVGGDPNKHEVNFMYRENDAGNHGYRVAIHQSSDTTFQASFFNRTQWDNVCFGFLTYQYTAGTTSLLNTQVPTRFEAQKTWGEDVIPPEGSVVTFTLRASTSAGQIANLNDEIGIPADKQTITLNGKKDVEAAALSDTEELLADSGNIAEAREDGFWHALWTNLPQYDRTGKQIVYTAEETSYTINGETIDITNNDELKPTYEPAADGSPLTIVNKIPTTQVSAKKLWNDNQGTTLPANTKVTLKLTARVNNQIIALADLNVTPESVGLDGVVSEDQGEVETADTLWAYTWNQLPMYYNGKEVEYTVEETGYEIDGMPYDPVSADETPASGFDYSFTNTLPTVSVESTKTWENSAGEVITDIIQNVEVAFELQFRTSDQADWAPVAKDAQNNTITNPVVLRGDETPKWKASWTNLPKYQDGALIQYQVKETRALIETDNGKGGLTLPVPGPGSVSFPTVPAQNEGEPVTVDPNAGTSGITNRLPTTNISINKMWGGPGAAWPDEHISVKMKLMQEDAEGHLIALPDKIVQYTEPNPTGSQAPYAFVTLTNLTSSSWLSLPMYYDTGELINYKVVEDGVYYTPEGGTPVEISVGDYFDAGTTEWTASNGRFFSIDNKPKETEINVTKVWTMNGDTRTDKTAVAYKLFSKEGDTTQEIDLTEMEDDITASVGEMTLNQIKYISGDTSGTWQIIKIPGLPMYRMTIDPDAAQPVTFAPITYYVEEDRTGSELAAGTVISYSGEGAAETSTAAGAAITAGTITIYNRDDFDINLLKIDEATRDDDHPTVISQAGFQLKRFVESLAANGSDDPYENVGTEKFTDAEGKISFSGVGAGKYKIVEKTTPKGYIRTDEDEDIYFIVNSDGTLTWTDKDYHPIDPADPDDPDDPADPDDPSDPDDSVGTRPAKISFDESTITFTAGNTSGAALPYTGGPGTSLFYILGAVMAGFAAVLLGMRRIRH